MLTVIIDEDVPRSTGKVLEAQGLKAVDVRDHGLQGASDEAVFEFARQQSGAIITCDRGFGDIYRFKFAQTVGIVVVNLPDEIGVESFNKRLSEAFQDLNEKDIRGNVVVVELTKVRIRKRSEIPTPKALLF